MALLTSELISRAYYTSGVVSRDFETPTGAQVTDGLMLLNQVIVDRTVDEGTIPYTGKYEFNAIAGTSQYNIAGLIDIETLTFYIDDVRYQTQNQGRQDYFGSFRATDIESLPFNWHMERNLSGATLFLYFTPNAAYPLEIWGSFRLAVVTMFQDLSLTLDAFYTNFLQYLLSERICQFNSYQVPANVSIQLEKYYKWIGNQVNVMDLRQQKMSNLAGSVAINYGVVNLSGGWFPVNNH